MVKADGNSSCFLSPDRIPSGPRTIGGPSRDSVNQPFHLLPATTCGLPSLLRRDVFRTQLSQYHDGNPLLDGRRRGALRECCSNPDTQGGGTLFDEKGWMK
jgi:hypothetical protein